MAGFDNRAGFAFGDVVFASYGVPEEEVPVRGPCVIISSMTYNQQRGDVLAMTIVHVGRPNVSSGEIAIQNVDAAGLEAGAVLRPVVITLEQRLVRLILGHLDDRDRQSLRHLLNLILGE